MVFGKFVQLSVIIHNERFIHIYRNINTRLAS
jgi:hypothetical protein